MKIKQAHYNPLETTPVEEIKASLCIQCKTPYDEYRTCVWTRTTDTHKVIWWHPSSPDCLYLLVKKVKDRDLMSFRKFEQIRKQHAKNQLRNVDQETPELE